MINEITNDKKNLPSHFIFFILTSANSQKQYEAAFIAICKDNLRSFFSPSTSRSLRASFLQNGSLTLFNLFKTSEKQRDFEQQFIKFLSLQQYPFVPAESYLTEENPQKFHSSRSNFILENKEHFVTKLMNLMRKNKYVVPSLIRILFILSDSDVGNEKFFRFILLLPSKVPNLDVVWEIVRFIRKISFSSFLDYYKSFSDSVFSLFSNQNISIKTYLLTDFLTSISNFAQIDQSVLQYILKSDLFVQFLNNFILSDSHLDFFNSFPQFNIEENMNFPVSKILKDRQEEIQTGLSILNTPEEIIRLMSKNPKDPMIRTSICQLDNFELNFPISINLPIFEILDFVASSKPLSDEKMQNKYVQFVSTLVTKFCLENNFFQVKNKILELEAKNIPIKLKWELSKIRYNILFCEEDEQTLEEAFHELFDFLFYVSSLECGVSEQSVLFILLMIGNKIHFKNLFYNQLSSLAFFMSGLTEIKPPLDAFFEQLICLLSDTDFEGLKCQMLYRVETEPEGKDFYQERIDLMESFRSDFFKSFPFEIFKKYSFFPDLIHIINL
jgi:hypothetical protein